MNLRTNAISLLPFFLGAGIWVKDGSRLAFWLTSVEEKKEIHILEGMPEFGTQTQITWREEFVSGIETPLLGLILSLGLLAFFILRKKRSSS